MNLIALTVNHKTAPIDIREELHLSKEEIISFIPEMKDKLFSDAVILSTCNRTEIFGFPIKPIVNFKDIQEFLLTIKKPNKISDEHFNKYFSCGAVKHLFNVSAGLDSLMIGDSQILGQVKDAFQIADDQGFVGSIMRKIFESALKVGKRSIKETMIGEGAVSVSYAAIQLVEKIFSALDKKSALIIGAGETATLAARHLKDKGLGQITITNRTLEKAEILAVELHGQIIPFDYFKEHIHEFDVIISATSSTDILLRKNEITASMKKRKNSPVCIMDIAIPRDIDAGVSDIYNVFYHDIDSLKLIVEQNMKKRESEIPKVEKIIMEEMISLFSWYNTLEIIPTIKTLRDFFESIRRDELTKSKNKFSENDLEKIDDMTRRLIGRILHNPTIKLRELAESGVNLQDAANFSFVLSELFGIDKSIDNK